jgi:hypothetical protein
LRLCFPDIDSWRDDGRAVLHKIGAFSASKTCKATGTPPEDRAIRQPSSVGVSGHRRPERSNGSNTFHEQPNAGGSQQYVSDPAEIDIG